MFTQKNKKNKAKKVDVNSFLQIKSPVPNSGMLKWVNKPGARMEREFISKC